MLFPLAQLIPRPLTRWYRIAAPIPGEIKIVGMLQLFQKLISLKSDGERASCVVELSKAITIGDVAELTKLSGSLISFGARACSWIS